MYFYGPFPLENIVSIEVSFHNKIIKIHSVRGQTSRKHVHVFISYLNFVRYHSTLRKRHDSHVSRGYPRATIPTGVPQNRGEFLRSL